MSKLVWDASGAHIYETGVKNGVLYLLSTTGATSGTYPQGVVWNGLTSISESPEGADANDMYADDQKYLSIRAAEDFKGTINAYTYPEEFGECNGELEIATGVVVGQQARKTFGLAYKTTLGNDIANNDYGYKLHLVYGATVSPSQKEYATINDSPEAIEFSWEFKTIPVNVPNMKPSAIMTIDSTKADVTCLKTLEAVLFGTEEFSASSTYALGDLVEHTESNVAKLYKCTTAVTSAAAWDASDWTEVGTAGARLPLPAEVIALMAPANE